MSLYSVRFKPFLRAVVLFLLINICIITLYAKRVEPSVAQTVASTFLRNNGDKSDQLTDVSAKAGFSNLYIFNGENGFVIVAADDRVKPILGYSLTEKFVIENMPENLRFWLQGYNDEIQYVIDNQIRASEYASQEWDDLKNGKPNVARTTVVVEPLIHSEWGQDAPYNEQCPNGYPTGCVATAMAQIMKKWNYPEHGYGSHSYPWNNTTLSADFGNTTYDWANMTDTYNNSSSETEKTAVATLMYHCGVSVNMDYGEDVSLANLPNAVYAYKLYFGYSNGLDFKERDLYTDLEWKSMLQTELNAGRPLQYQGADANGNNGHSFICDGYDSEDMFHFNWGWDQHGANNAYYSIDNLVPIGESFVFNDYQGAIFGIEPYGTEPTVGDCSAPTDLSASLSGRTVTLSWTAAEGVSSYRIYRNDELIASNVTGTQYIDSTLEPGSYDYYLRSNCSDGSVSGVSTTCSVGIEYENTTYVAIGDFYYSLYEQNKTAHVNKHIDGLSVSGDITIPSSVEYTNSYGQTHTYIVTTIIERAFKGCSHLTHVIIPSSVKSIGYHAFYNTGWYNNQSDGILYLNNWCLGYKGSKPSGSLDIRMNTIGIANNAFSTCTSLTFVTIPNTVENIGSLAFYGCSGLTSLIIPNSVTSIGFSAFEGCSNLATVYWNAVSVTGFSSTSPFGSCANLNTVIFGNSVERIPNCAFKGCSGLTSLTIGNLVTSIGSSAFEGCSNLATVYWNAVNVTDTSPFGSCANLNTVIFGNSVERIPNYALEDCSGLTSVTIPNSVTSIGSRALYGCSGLTTLVIPNSVTSIGSYAFYGCSGLTSLTIPNSLTTIEEYVFDGCSSLTSVTIPNSVTSIGRCAFYGCSGLTSLTIPNSLTTIEEYVFDGCSSLTSVTIPNSVTSIGRYAFNGCSGLTSLTIGNSVTSIGNYSFSGCSNLATVYWNAVSVTDFSSTSPFGSCANLNAVIFGNSVERIPNCAFKGCSGLTSLTIGNSVTSIGSSAFYGCSGLTSLTIGNSVTSIGRYAFAACSGLTSLTIGNSVTSIGSSAFGGCSNLATVYWNAVSVTDFSSTSPFGSCANLTVIFGNSVERIPNYALEDCSGLASLTIGNSVTSIGSSAFEGCSNLATVYWNAENVTGYPDYSHRPFKNCTNIESVIFSNSVLAIPSYAFDGCSGLTSLTIPNSVTSIGSSAFYGCSGLTSLTIPNSVTSIGSYAFDRCSGLTSLTIPNSVTSIGSYAFYGCSGLTSLTISNSLTTIEEYVFDGCSSLTSVTIPNSVTSIGRYAFCGCSDLTSLTIGNSVTDIGEYAFSSCSGLTTLEIPNSVTSINNDTFSGCSGLKSVTIGNSVQNIGDYAFNGCSGLKSVILGNSINSIGKYAFTSCSGLEAVYYQGDVETWCNIDFAYNGSNPLLYANNLYIDNELVTDIVIPETVTAIKKYVFIGYSSLATVTISNSVTSIGNSAFDGCSNLTSVTIASSVASIGNYAFDGCGSLNAIRVQWSNPITINHNSFYGVDRSVPVYVPCGSQDDYKAAQYWSEFENINESQHNLALINNDKDGGDITVLKWADCEDNHCAILATPNIGYDFVGWYVNDELSTLEPFCDFSLTEDITFEGRFERTASHNIANGTSNVWSNSDTWDLGVVPTSTSTVGIRKSIKVDVDATVSSLGIYDNSVLTVLSGVTLTITDTLGSTKASSIIIEDGGQLIHSSNGAMATIKQSIEPYTSDEDGWNLISYPMTGNGSISSVNNMLSNLYDLYYYDEPNERWVNSKDDNNSFTDLEAGKGYLYANIGMGVGAAAGSTIGDGSLTTGYTPFYTYYNYSISEILFRVSELESAGLATAEMGALCWYATNETGRQQNNISIWMANVEDDELTSTSHNVAGMTLVYTGSMKPIIGWNEFVFNENNFTWDGTSNILICVQRNNGAWNGAINWQSHNPGFNAVSYNYTDNNAYDMTSETYSMTVSTTRPNTVFQTIEQIGHYASYEPITMSYAGQLANGAAEVTIHLSYTGGHRLSGFNLVGNPFVHNVTSYATTDVADGCFRINDSKTNLIVSQISVENPLRPAEGFFVKATGNNASVTFNSQTQEKNEDKGSIQLEIVQNDKLIDRFIVKEGVKLNKISLSGEHIELYAKTNNQKYAIVPFNGQEQAVNFKTFKMGTFTINVKVENMDLPYLHLVDNFTGQDIDLLITPSYTFNATSIDNESRFRLVFDQKFAVNNNDVFAYQYGDEIIVNGKGTLQVFDVLGRIVANYQINGMESISNPSQKGVYVLRLLGDNLKTQKIVVK